MKTTWNCPKCGAEANEHGKGDCLNRRACCGFICECEGDMEAEHGQSLADPCLNANCYHCGWGGVFPKKPKGLLPWEKKALEAGWKMPAQRAKELSKASRGAS